MAATSQYWPASSAMLAISRMARVADEGSVQVSNRLKPRLAKVTTAAEVVTMTSGGTPGATLRESRSRAAENSTDTIASTAKGVNAVPPGRTINNTPTRPIEVAVHRRQPTWAPMNSAAPAVTASGTN